MTEFENSFLGGNELQRKLDLHAAYEWAGVYAVTPAASPKYHTGGDIDSVFRQARFLLPAASKAQANRIKSLAGSNKYLRRIIEQTIVRGDPTANIETPDRNLRGPNEYGGLGYVDFLAQSFSIQFREQYQVHELLADAYAAYYHGQAAPTIALQGYVCNTRQNNWFDAFMELYQGILRGTQIATIARPLWLKVDSRLYACSFTQCSLSISSATESSGTFSLQGIVKQILLLEKNLILYPTQLKRITDIRRKLNTLDEAKRQAASAIESARLISEFESDLETREGAITGVDADELIGLIDTTKSSKKKKRGRKMRRRQTAQSGGTGALLSNAEEQEIDAIAALVPTDEEITRALVRSGDTSAANTDPLLPPVF